MARFGRSYIRLGLVRPVELESNLDLSNEDLGAFTEAWVVAATLSSADTSSSTEAQSLVVAVSSSDTGTATEAVLRIALTAPDTGSGTEASSIAATLTGSDTGSGTETGGLAQTQGDTVTATEASSIAVTLSSADTGTGVDAGSVNADGAPNSSDTGSGTETSSIAATLSATDIGTGAESGYISQAAGDTGSGSESATVVVNLSSSDTGSGTDAGSLVASVSGSDTGSLLDLGFPEGYVPPVEPHNYSQTLVMGPATVYIGAYGAPEPADAAVASTPSGTYWRDLGGTVSGVDLTIKREFKSVELVQSPDKHGTRLVKEEMRVAAKIAEPRLDNFLVLMNEGAVATGAGWETYTPSAQIDEATPLTYQAVIVDGWSPELNSNGGQKRRRVIMRKCLSIEGTIMEYSKDKQTAQAVTWSAHRVDGVIAPFKIIDED